MKIVWSPLSLDRASEIAEYIARDKLSAARQWIETLFEKTDNLMTSPEMGRVAPEIQNRRIRELI
jgi:toxin ParE1/3/4